MPRALAWLAAALELEWPGAATAAAALADEAVALAGGEVPDGCGEEGAGFETGRLAGAGAAAGDGAGGGLDSPASVVPPVPSGGFGGALTVDAGESTPPVPVAPLPLPTEPVPGPPAPDPFRGAAWLAGESDAAKADRLWSSVSFLAAATD